MEPIKIATSQRFECIICTRNNNGSRHRAAWFLNGIGHKYAWCTKHLNNPDAR